MTMGVYKITNLINNKIYVGSSINIERRWNQHKYHFKIRIHSNEYFQRSWDVYGEDNFKFEIVEVVDNIDNLLEVEQKWIDESKCYLPEIGYNAYKKANATYEYSASDETYKKLRGRNNKREIVLTEEQVKEIYLLLYHGLSVKQIRDIYNVSAKPILHIKQGNLWDDIKKDINFETPLSPKLQKIIDKLKEEGQLRLSISQSKLIYSLLDEKHMKLKEIAQYVGVTIHQVEWISRNKYKENKLLREI